jgi:hypothetical protein
MTGLFAFPTTLFVGRDGRVRKIHSGFAGPGTGAHHAKLVAELQALLETLLGERSPEGPAGHGSSQLRAPHPRLAGVFFSCKPLMKNVSSSDPSGGMHLAPRESHGEALD